MNPYANVFSETALPVLPLAHFTDFPVSLPIQVARDVEAALAEDVGQGDLTASLIPLNQQATATVVVREPAVLCGCAWFESCFHKIDPAVRVDWAALDGAKLTDGQTVCTLEGDARSLLTGERSALNFLQLLSGVATRTALYAEHVKGTRAQVVDTRKTIPGLRVAQKYAVRVGGGGNHRLALWDAILIKENHILAAGGISQALSNARVVAQSAAGRCRFIQIEVENLFELEQALSAGAEMILLDNFGLEDLRRAILVNSQYPHPAILEASGGISLETLRAVAETGVDRISVGGLTKDVGAIDLSMRFSVIAGD